MVEGNHNTRVKEKKQIFKERRRNKEQEAYVKCTLACEHVKHGKKAKRKTWTEFGLNMSKDCKTATISFLQSSQSNENRKPQPSRTNKRQRRQPISLKDETLQKWEEYFEDYLIQHQIATKQHNPYK